MNQQPSSPGYQVQYKGIPASYTYGQPIDTSSSVYRATNGGSTNYTVPTTVRAGDRDRSVSPGIPSNQITMSSADFKKAISESYQKGFNQGFQKGFLKARGDPYAELEDVSPGPIFDHPERESVNRNSFYDNSASGIKGASPSQRPSSMYSADKTPKTPQQEKAYADDRMATHSFAVAESVKLLDLYFPGQVTNTSSDEAIWRRRGDQTPPRYLPGATQSYLPKGDNYASNVVKVENVADLDRARRERDPNRDPRADSPSNDLKGENRNWVNWDVPTYSPTPAKKLPQYTGPGSHAVSDTTYFSPDLSQYTTLLQELQERRSLYLDPLFPPEYRSILGDSRDPYDRQRGFERMQWKRPNEIFGNGTWGVFMRGEPNPDDIKQGTLGDCYFLATIAAIAEDSKRISRLFPLPQTQPGGAYVVKVCITGIWENIIVDDLFPCHYIDGMPSFSSSDQKEIWVMLLEKVWAKIHGGFCNIEAGTMRDPLRDLTGAPTITFFTDRNKSNRKYSSDDLWNILYEADKKRFIMGCGTGDIMGQGTDSQDPSTGLCGNHAYSLIGVYEVLSEGRNKRRLRVDERGKYPANMVERLVKLRNPWAIGEWIGDWNLGNRNPARNAEQWSSPQLTKELHRSDNPNDGTFHMPFNSFLQYFDEIQVCYYYDNYKYSAQKYQSSPKEPTIIKLI